MTCIATKELVSSLLVVALLVRALPIEAQTKGTAKLWTDAEVATSKPLVDLPGFSAAVKKLKPSVVSFYVQSVVKIEENPMYDFFRDIFPHIPRSFTEVSAGSGVIINEDGYVLTNAHVVSNVKSIKVVLSTGESYEGKVIGTDAATDLALVKIAAPRKLQPALLGDSDKLNIGDWVLAIGNPFGLETTVTAGIVSAKGRNEVALQLRYQDMIQTDAPINPGNSGGPLVDVFGNVVGITTAIAAGGEGIGFAIPINMAKQLLPQLLKYGKVKRSWLGVTVQGLNDLLAKSFGLAGREGAIVVEVHGGSPAAEGGIKVGDVILELDGKKITNPDKLAWYASTTEAGKKVAIKVVREGQERMMTVKLAPMPEEESKGGAKGKSEGHKPTAPRQKGGKEEIKVAEIDPDAAIRLGLMGADGRTIGVVVTALDEESAFAVAGVKRGDIILEVNGVPCRDPSSFYEALKKVRKGEIVRLYMISANKRGFIAFEKQ